MAIPRSKYRNQRSGVSTATPASNPWKDLFKKFITTIRLRLDNLGHTVKRTYVRATLLHTQNWTWVTPFGSQMLMNNPHWKKTHHKSPRTIFLTVYIKFSKDVFNCKLWTRKSFITRSNTQGHFISACCCWFAVKMRGSLAFAHKIAHLALK